MFIPYNLVIDIQISIMFILVLIPIFLSAFLSTINACLLSQSNVYSLLRCGNQSEFYLKFAILTHNYVKTQTIF